MGANRPRRVIYRVRQFFRVLTDGFKPLTPEERRTAWKHLPETAHRLYDAMPCADQRHSLRVLHTLTAAGHDEPALLQAALLHDCAKREAGIRIWHRVALVLLKTFWPRMAMRWEADPAPARMDWRYPMRAQLHHPERGAALAAAAGCDPLAVTLIRRHQDPRASCASDPITDRLVAALQAADDDN
jgi:hypothetical protein